ncbi:hypothetical protein EHM82_07945 [bacterium]|nr:MAG: hypothetical protein EHM82_07945 [bacterium]
MPILRQPADAYDGVEKDRQPVVGFGSPPILRQRVEPSAARRSFDGASGPHSSPRSRPGQAGRPFETEHRGQMDPNG